MRKALKRNGELYYYKDEEKIILDCNNVLSYPIGLSGIISSNLSGDISGITGDISGISGNVSNLFGDVSEISGDISNIYGEISSNLSGDLFGISGNVFGISGNIDDCELTEEDRKKGVDIENLVK